MANFSLATCTGGPAQCGQVVGYVEKYWEWVICGICAENHVESSTVVDDNGYKLEDID